MIRGQCSECGETLPEVSDDGRDSSACPFCGGSQRPTFTAQAALVIRLPTFSAQATVIAPSILQLPPLLLQAVVEFGNKTPDGQLIEAVAPAWVEIIKLLKSDPSALTELSPRKMEEMIAGWYSAAGWEVTLTPPSGDLGRDVIAISPGFFKVRIIDQVKKYKPNHLVKADEVRALIGVLKMDDKATMGVVTTTSDFAPKIKDDPFIAPLIPHRLELINGPHLLDRLDKIANPPKPGAQSRGPL